MDHDSLGYKSRSGCETPPRAGGQPPEHHKMGYDVLVSAVLGGGVDSYGRSLSAQIVAMDDGVWTLRETPISST